MARSTRLAATAGVGAFLALSAACSSGSAGTQTQAKPFWSHLAGHGSEINLPQSVDDIAKRSHAIVIARVTGVTDGRAFKGYGDGTIEDPTAPKIRTVFVQLTVDKVIAGSIAENETVKLEMFAPPKPLSIDTVRSKMPPDQLLFFLYNKAARAKADGFTSPVIQLTERDIWDRVSSLGIIAAGSSGLYTALHPDETDTPFLQSFQARTLDEAAARSAQALR